MRSCIFIASLFVGSSALAGPFILLDQYQSTNSSEKFSFAGINNADQVVITGSHAVNPSPNPLLNRTQSYVYLGSGSSLTLVDSFTRDNWIYPSNNPSSGYSIGGFASINNAGQIAYAARSAVTSQASRIYRWDNGVRTEVMNGTGTLTTGPSSLNDAGTILAFGVGTHYVINGSVTTYSNNGNVPDLNNNGDAAFATAAGPGLPWTVHIRDGSGVDHDVTGPSAGPHTMLPIAMNDQGNVVHLWNNGDIYESGIGTASTLLVDLDPSQNLYDIAINNNGDVAFTTNNSSLTAATLYYLPAGSATPIELLHEGENFLGSAIADLRISSDGLNDLGRIALSYFSNSGGGVAVIQAIPEVGSIEFLVMAIISFGAFRQVRGNPQA
ncbi:hypothetical protein K2Y11_08170 [bacterium]|nr:hypothetical protein [bacterium]